MKIAGGVYACQSCQAESNGNAKEVIADQNKNEMLRDSSGLKLAKVGLSLRPFSSVIKDGTQKRSDSALALNSWWPWNNNNDNEPNSPLFDSKVFCCFYKTSRITKMGWKIPRFRIIAFIVH